MPRGLQLWAFVGVLALVTALAAGLRFHRLADPSLWADEMFQVRDALGGGGPGYNETRWGLRVAGAETAAAEPEAYWRWKARGFDEWNMRLGSVVAGLGAVPVLALLSAPFLGAGCALLLALLLALHPWHLEWSQHARFYAPMFLYYNGALALYLRGALAGRIAPLVAAMVLATLAVAVKPTSLMVFGVIGIDLAVTAFRIRRLPLSPISLAVLAAGAVVCALLTASWFEAGSGPYREPLERAVSMSPFKLGALHAFTVGLPIAASALGALLWLVRQPSHGRTVLFLATATGVPLAAFGALALTTNVEVRYTFLSLYGWLALAALGLGELFRVLRPLGMVPALLPLAVVAAQLLRDVSVYYEAAYGNRGRWRHAFTYVREHRQPDESVVTLEKWAGSYYLEDSSVRSIDLEFDGLESLDADTWFVVKSTAFEIDEGRPHWLDGKADMRAVFPNRIPFPQTTVRVYHYRPPQAP